MRKGIVKQKGQTLIETVVVLGIVVLLVTGIVSATIASLKASQNNRARSIATKLIQEGLEIARSDRDASWSQFINLSGSYCFDNNKQTYFGLIPGDPNNCSSFPYVILPPLSINFIRYTTFSKQSVGGYDQMSVLVTVKWTESGQSRSSRTETYFTQWK